MTSSVSKNSSVSKPTQNKNALLWLKKNLFATIPDTILTLFCAYLLWVIVPPVFNWLIFDANFIGTSRDACSSGGACWVFIKERFYQIVYGFYPNAQAWRVNITILLFFGTIGTWFLPMIKEKKWLAIWTFVAFPATATVLLKGGSFGLEVVETAKWGGMFLTLVVSSIGIVCSLPIGIVLALGRRSKMPIVRTACTLFIEFWRGVPLITVLFMSSVMLPLFFPDGVTFDKLLRALIGVALFSAAYMAEVVRGGLQALPKGQYEAAESMGFGYWKSMYLIIMPQALKTVIPGIVNTFIGLFKDTTLVAIIGMFDLLGIVQAAATDPDWLGYATEGYVFAALFYWVFCWTMSKYSQHLEKKLHTGL